MSKGFWLLGDLIHAAAQLLNGDVAICVETYESQVLPSGNKRLTRAWIEPRKKDNDAD